MTQQRVKEPSAPLRAHGETATAARSQFAAPALLTEPLASKELPPAAAGAVKSSLQLEAGWNFGDINVHREGRGTEPPVRPKATAPIAWPPPAIQAKLAVNRPGDSLEQEADLESERVLSTQNKGAVLDQQPWFTPPVVQRLQSGALPSSAAGAAPSAVERVVATPGRPLDAGTRAFFEPRFGFDFSRVRVHTDREASESAQAVNALAYTAGAHIAFAEGGFSPHTESGRRLLGHELTHVVQQSGALGSAVQRKPKKQNDSVQGGSVLFVQVDRSADTITFVTESGSYSYKLLTPTEIPAGNYTFGVKFEGQNFRLEAPGEITTFSGFKYRIAADQPNPAKMLKGQKSVSVMVMEANKSAGAGGFCPLPGGADLRNVAPEDVITLPVTYSAFPLDPEPGAPPMLSSLATGTGMGLHNLAFNNLSWLDSPASYAYWSSLVPRSGTVLDRVTGGFGSPASVLKNRLKPTLSTFLETHKEGDPFTWVNKNNQPLEFQPDAGAPLRRPFTAEEMLSVDGLIRRYNANPASLSPSELQMLREVVRIHLGGSTPRSPVSSFSVPDHYVSWSNKRRFVVRVNVEPGAALDLSTPNAFNNGIDSITSLDEYEFVVVGDQSGRIISVESAEAAVKGNHSWAFRNANVIRWGGRVMLVGGVAYSGYRIANAKPEEKARVVGEEGGGFLGGLGGSAAATAGCAVFGLATEGVGLFFCGLIGGAVGGAAGSHLGGEALGHDWVGDWANEASQRENEHMEKLNPGITGPQAARLQDMMDDFDTWGIR